MERLRSKSKYLEKLEDASWQHACWVFIRLPSACLDSLQRDWPWFEKRFGLCSFCVFRASRVRLAF